MIRFSLIGAAITLIAVLPAAAQEYVPDPKYAVDTAAWEATPKTCAGYRAYMEGDTVKVYYKEAATKRTELECLKPSAGVIELSSGNDLRAGTFTADDFPARAQDKRVKGWATIECLADAGKRLTNCRIVKENPAEFGFGVSTLRAVIRRGRTIQSYPDGQRLQFTVHWQPR